MLKDSYYPLDRIPWLALAQVPINFLFPPGQFLIHLSTIV